MALSAQLTKISLAEAYKPTGYTETSGANLASSQPSYIDYEVSVAKASVEAATKATTFDAIREDIETQIAAKLTADDLGTVKTVAYNIDWKAIRNNQILSEEFYTDVAEAYICTVDVYLNIS